MSFSHFYDFTRLKVLIFAVLALQIVACSGGNGGDSTSSGDSIGGVDSNINPVINMLGLTWTAPSEREDGSALSLSDIAGYRIYYGAKTEDYQNQIDISDISADQAQVANLAPGTYYIVMTTIDTDGRESSYSPEVEIAL